MTDPINMAEKATNQIDLESKLITVASGKGGVGKTWLSVTLAHALSHEGRRVLLFDGDLGLANVDIQLGLVPDRDLGDVINDSSDLAGIVTTYQDNSNPRGQLDIIPGRSGSGNLGTLARERLKGLRTGLIAMAARYDHVVLDLSAGVDAAVTTLSDHRGRIFVVMTGDPTSLTDAYAFIKLTVMRDPQADIQIVVNNVASRQDGEKAFNAISQACKNFLGFQPKLATIVKTDAKVIDSIRNQIPILSRHPQSDAAKAVEELAASIPAMSKAMAG